MATQQTKSITKRVFEVIAGCALAVVAAVLVAVGSLAYPGQPTGGKTLRFEGYVLLPKTGVLNVLDYMTLRNRQLFVTSESAGAVNRIDLPENEVPAGATFTVMNGTGATHGVALLPAGEPAFVTRSETNTVDAFNPETMQIVKSIPVAEDADADLYDPETKLVYVANGDAHLATLIDPKQMQTVGTIALGGKPEFPALDPEKHLLYQNLRDISKVAVVDLHTRTKVGQWDLPGCTEPSGLSLDQQDRRLFVVCAGNAKLVVLNLETHAEVALLPIGGGPDSVVYDPALRQIYTAGKGGLLVVVHQQDADHYEVVDRIKAHYGAHTLAVDLRTHKVFLGYASFLVAPRVAVFSAIP